MKYGRSSGGAKEFVAFPVLVVLSRKPCTIGEISRTLLTSRASVSKHLKALERLGYVMKRADGRWVMIVRVRMEGLPVDEAGRVTRAPGERMQEVALSDIPNPTRQEPLGEAREVKGRQVVDPPPVVAAAGQQLSLAQRFGVPERNGDGELSLGPLQQCAICGKERTPLRYGTRATCKKCGSS